MDSNTFFINHINYGTFLPATSFGTISKGINKSHNHSEKTEKSSLLGDDLLSNYRRLHDILLCVLKTTRRECIFNITVHLLQYSLTAGGPWQPFSTLCINLIDVSFVLCTVGKLKLFFLSCICKSKYIQW